MAGETESPSENTENTALSSWPAGIVKSSNKTLTYFFFFFFFFLPRKGHLVTEQTSVPSNETQETNA